jgi:hypothetical protein
MERRDGVNVHAMLFCTAIHVSLFQALKPSVDDPPCMSGCGLLVRLYRSKTLEGLSGSACPMRSDRK